MVPQNLQNILASSKKLYSKTTQELGDASRIHIRGPRLALYLKMDRVVIIPYSAQISYCFPGQANATSEYLKVVIL